MFFFLSCSDEDGKDDFPMPAGKGNRKEPTKKQAGSKRKIPDEVAATEVEKAGGGGGGKRGGMCVLNMDH